MLILEIPVQNISIKNFLKLQLKSEQFLWDTKVTQHLNSTWFQFKTDRSPQSLLPVSVY